MEKVLKIWLGIIVGLTKPVKSWSGVSSYECKILLFTILVLNVREHVCVVAPVVAKEGNVRVWIERNLTTESEVKEIDPPRVLPPVVWKRTISLDESINNSSLLRFQSHFSFSAELLRRWSRVRRAPSERDEDQEKLDEDHARSFRLFYFLGGIAIVIFTVIFLATLLCFCCPSCYMAKRRIPGAGGDSLSGSGVVCQSSGSFGAAETTTTISAARSSSIVMATLPLQHRLSQDLAAHRRSQDYSNQTPIPSTSQAFTYSSPDKFGGIE